MAAYEHPAAARAQDLYAGQGLSGLQLYHGSPHLFDEFDFLTNMGKGEGAQAFGPGGYLTGHQPLGQHYADTLAEMARRTGGFRERAPARPSYVGGAPPPAWKVAYAHDPEGFLEFLRGRTMGKAQRYGLSEPVQYSTNSARSGYRTAGVEPQNFGAYLEALGSVGGDKFRGRVLGNLTGRVQGSSMAPQEAADLGRALLDKGALSEGWPRLSKTTGELPQARSDGSRVTMIRQNLNAVQEGLSPGSTPRRPTFKASMKKNIYLPEIARSGMRDVDPAKMSEYATLLAGWKERRAAALAAQPEIKSRLYEAHTPATPSEMFSYDWPLKVSSPHVVAKLAKVAGDLGLGRLPQDASFADMTGSQFMNAIDQGSAERKKKAVLAFREAGIPGMYFQRAGRRGANEAPATFDSNDHNFVWFDDPLLQVKKRTDRAHGGAV